MFKALLKPVDGSQARSVALERTARVQHATHRARVDDVTLEVELEQTCEGGGWLRLRQHIFPFHAARVGERIQVWLGGKVYELEPVDQTPRRAGAALAAGNKGHVTAPMPGTILKIQVAAGDSFEAHEPLIIMESMKMEMTLSVPHGGRVKKSLCTVGQLVEMGATLLELEPDEDDTETA